MPNAEFGKGGAEMDHSLNGAELRALRKEIRRLEKELRISEKKNAQLKTKLIAAEAR